MPKKLKILRRVTNEMIFDKCYFLYNPSKSNEKLYQSVRAVGRFGEKGEEDRMEKVSA